MRDCDACLAEVCCSAALIVHESLHTVLYIFCKFMVLHVNAGMLLLTC